VSIVYGESKPWMLWALIICQSWNEESNSVGMVLVAMSQGDVGIGGDITC
jgi:hypothetical protein